MEKQKLFKKIGSLQQLLYVRELEYHNGRADKLRVYDVKNEMLNFKCMIDKCLDISELSYKGVNFNFLSKPGLQGRNHYDTNGEEALRSIMGGMFFTAGYENICAPYTTNNKNYPMHGRMRTTPCENLSADCYYENDNYKIVIKGEAREAELFGENMLLRRKIETSFGSKKIILTDEVENQSYRDEPFLVLYHINFGFPLLDTDTEIIAPSKSVKGREDYSENKKSKWQIMEEPIDNEKEYCFSHEVISNANNFVTAGIVNNKLNLGFKITYDKKHLPYLLEWKSLMSGDYVVGLEPSNGYFGREYEERNNSLHMLKPFEKEKIVLEFEILDGKDDINNFKNEIRSIVYEEK